MTAAEIRPVVDYEGLYEVSSEGDVFRVASGKGTWVGRKLKPYLNTSGYLYVTLYRNGVGKLHRIHRIVAKAFHPNPNNFPTVNHINGIKTDNRADNLEWCTSSRQLLHAYHELGIAAGFKQGHQKLEGSGTPSRPVRGTNIKTCAVVEIESMAAAAMFVHGHPQNIRHACRGRQKTAYGWMWEYI